MNEFMARAIDEARKGIRNGDGGPFGAVVVRNGSIIASGHNRVVSGVDPTAHAEIVAIREACRKLGRFELSDCSLYTTCEPCPMCRSAIHWARISDVTYGCERTDAARIGFDDELLYRVLAGDEQAEGYVTRSAEREACLELFREYESLDDRVMY